jgi:hypothetical protein
VCARASAAVEDALPHGPQRQDPRVHVRRCPNRRRAHRPLCGSGPTRRSVKGIPAAGGQGPSRAQRTGTRRLCWCARRRTASIVGVRESTFRHLAAGTPRAGVLQP